MGTEKQNRLKETDRKKMCIHCQLLASVKSNGISWLLLTPQPALEINATMEASVHKHIIPHCSSFASATKVSQGSSVK